MVSTVEVIGNLVIISVLLKVIFSILRLFYEYYIGSLFGLSCDFKKYGKWCIITGSTDGIGKAYAFAMAKRGLDLILISRNVNRLQATSQEITRKYGVQTKIIAIDFSTNDDSIYEEIKREVQDMEVGILINNVGYSQMAAIFTDIPERDIVMQDIININLKSCWRMTSLILPQMVKRQKGIILNVSSLSSVIPMCGFSLYGSVKQAVDYFSKTLAMEYKNKGIVIQSVVPGYVSTKMSRVKPSLIAPIPENYVCSQLRTVGLCVETSGYIMHSIMAGAGRMVGYWLPTSVQQFIIISTLADLIKHDKKKILASQKSK